MRRGRRGATIAGWIAWPVPRREVQTIAGKAGGLGVVIGARVGALAGASEVFVSQTVKDLVAGSGLMFEDRGMHTLKGVPDEWRLYAAVQTRREAVSELG